MKSTQEDLVLRYLKKHRGITGITALKKLGIMHLPKRINNLKKRGIVIQSMLIPVKNRFGEKVRISKYWLV